MSVELGHSARNYKWSEDTIKKTNSKSGENLFRKLLRYIACVRRPLFIRSRAKIDLTGIDSNFH